MKNGFFFYENFKTTADSLPDNLRLKFYDALTNYAINGVEPEDNILKALITAFKPSINKIETRGGNNNPTGQNQYSEVKSGQKEVKSGQSGQSFNKQETGNNKIKRNKKEKVFIPPTIDEVREYVAEKKLSVSPQAFIDYFEAGNWIDSKGKPVLNWKQKILTWQNNTTPAKTEEHPEWTEQQRYIYSIPADISSMDGGWYDFVTNRFVAPPNTKPDWSKFDQVTREFKQ